MSDKSITQLVRMMLRGIETAVPIDPLQAAQHFETTIKEMGLFYAHHDGVGYVLDDDDEVMMVHFKDDGVDFDEHHEHPQTLKVIQCVLNSLTHMENQSLFGPDETDDDSDDFDWV